jgi:hypothetical protein
MQLILKLIFSLFAVLTTAQAFSQTKVVDGIDLSTQALLKECRAYAQSSAAKTYNQGLCIGIILGVEDNASYDHKFCIPPNTSIKERITTIENFIKNNPSYSDAPFASNVYDALVRKWPCKVTKD